MTPRQYRARRIVYRAIERARAFAAAGNAGAARRTWARASRLAMQCGGISGAAWAGGGRSAIVIDRAPEDAFVAFSPVPLISGASNARIS
jgi:hypothetical protein